MPRKKREADKSVLTVDLHGMSVDQAMEALEIALDRALLNELSRIELIHGRGRGILREASEKYLTSSKHVKRFALDPSNEGTTWIYL